jgi:hypothetical protein
MPIPQTPQGNLNRLRASVVIDAFPELNVTSDYLGTEGIRLAFDSNATDLLNTMTGMVSSPAPYQAVTLTMALVKSTPLAALYQAQFGDTTLMGTATVRPDAPNMAPYPLLNMVLETVREQAYTGLEPVMVVTMRGYWLVNAGFFDD